MQYTRSNMRESTKSFFRTEKGEQLARTSTPPGEAGGVLVGWRSGLLSEEHYGRCDERLSDSNSFLGLPCHRLMDGRVRARRVALPSTFPDPPRRTRRASFPATGSPEVDLPLSVLPLSLSSRLISAATLAVA